MEKIVVILAGGLGTRLGEITKKIPKILVKINDIPFIYHQLDLLSYYGWDKVIFCVGYLGSMVEDEIGKKYKELEIEYSYDEQLGTGGALRKALPLLSNKFMIMYGDSYLPINYNHIWNTFIQSNKLGLITIYQNNNIGEKSNIFYQNQEILKYNKKNCRKCEYIDYGITMLTYDCLFSYPENMVFDLSVIHKDIIASKSVIAYESYSHPYQIGNITGLKLLENYFKKWKGW